MNGEAKASVDGVIEKMKLLDDRLLLVEHDLWEAFIEETGMQPEPINGNDERVLYCGVELRPSGNLSAQQACHFGALGFEVAGALPPPECLFALPPEPFSGVRA